MKELPLWLRLLDDEDLAFMRRFLLNSGSLKETAKDYGISYPTVRLRLDRLIARINAVEASEHRGPFEALLRALFAQGDLGEKTFEALLAAHREEKQEP